jgi:hypothetical protein
MSVHLDGASNKPLERPPALHPVVLGHGKPYFAGPQPSLRLMTNDRIGENVIRLTYVPA